MPLRSKSGTLAGFLLFVGFLLVFAAPAEAQNKKKKPPKKKSDANIIARGYNDVTTRNNFYFNAQLLYKGILTDIDLNYSPDYSELLPIYFHQKTEGFDAYGEDIQSIIKKTSIVMQLHDHTRWKDDVYLLLGQARYMNGEYMDAMNTFRFVVTTMEKDVGKVANKVDNKAKLKALKAKEAAKQAKERKKAMEAKKKEIKDKLASLKRDKEKEMAANAKNREKELKKRIKAKEKIIAYRKKGKKVPQKLIDIAYGKDEDEGEETVQQEAEEKKEEEKPEKETVTVVVKTDYRSEKKKQRQAEAERQRELAELADTIPMSEKEIERYDDLTFWEKIKHKEARPEALVWLAKSLMKLGMHTEAQSILEYAESLPKLTRKQREDVYAAQAYYYLEMKRYENALEALDGAVLYAKKKDRAFYDFLAGQVEELSGNTAPAMEHYQLVADGKADYRMKFNAALRMVGLLQQQGPEQDDAVLELLTKLLKDGSNKEFRDQIHYRIADIHVARGDYDQAIEHLQESITSSRDNPLQKGLSFKELGEVYLQLENYPAAAVLYDSAVAIIPTDYAHVKEVTARGAAVAAVAEQAGIIAVTDSLLVMSGMTDADLELYLAELEQKQKESEKKRRRGKETGVTDFISQAVTVETDGGTGISGNWYFYNPNLRSQGYTQFRLVWGERPLEYDWRRSSREITFDVAETEIEETTDTLTEETDAVAIALPDIPRTEEEIKEAHATLADAWYEFGQLMRNRLEMDARARTAFEKLEASYPDYGKMDRVYYYLYLIHSDAGNTARAGHYRDLILNGFPASQYAYAINHPYQPAGEGDERPAPAPIEQLYASTYTLFESGQYQQVIARRHEAYETYRENPYMPRFDFLEALSFGHLDSLEVLKAKLGEIVAKYPNHEVEKKAREYLSIINRAEEEEGFEDTVVVATEGDTAAFVSIYSNEDSENLFGMLAPGSADLDVRQMIQIIDQFNNNNFKPLKLRTSNAYLDKDTPLLLIKRFRKQSDALDYAHMLQSALPGIFPDVPAEQLNLMLISQENFRTLFTTKKLEEYQEFYRRVFQKASDGNE